MINSFYAKQQVETKQNGLIVAAVPMDWKKKTSIKVIFKRKRRKQNVRIPEKKIQDISEEEAANEKPLCGLVS